MFGAVQTHMRDMPKDKHAFTNEYFKTFYCHAKRRVHNTTLISVYFQDETKLYIFIHCCPVKNIDLFLVMKNKLQVSYFETLIF
jgi:hypothetical protein